MVRLYDAVAIANEPSIGLTLDGLLTFALLSGSDYDDGIKGCGAGIAHGLAKCTFQCSLIDAFHNGDQHGNRDDLLRAWREEVQQELRTNSQGFLPSRHPGIARDIPDNFPRWEILRLYIQPSTSW